MNKGSALKVDRLLDVGGCVCQEKSCAKGHEKVAIENPIGIMSTVWRKPDQIIQPWQFGHGETKATCLWIKGLPTLHPTEIVAGRQQRVWRMPPSKDRASKLTYHLGFKGGPDISLFKLQNTYTVDGDVAYIHMRSKSGEEMDTVIDAEDLERAKKYNWHARLELHSGRYYAMAAKRYRDENGKTRGTSIHLHRYIVRMDGKSQKYIVDHIDADDTLNNRKSNLRVTTHAHNSSNRKGANKNSNTGVRNVSYVKSGNCYYVQMMKSGKRFRWTFPAEQFEEACKFAEAERTELFGEYAGKGICVRKAKKEEYDA